MAEDMTPEQQAIQDKREALAETETQPQTTERRLPRWVITLAGAGVAGKYGVAASTVSRLLTPIERALRERAS